MKCGVELIERERIRYDRQLRLSEVGLKGQKKIKGTSVLVIGAGSLGCPVLQYLTAAGVGTIGIVDNDWVDESNLHSQILYSMEDLNKAKPLAAKEKLQNLNSHVSLKPHYIKFNIESAIGIAKNYDILVDCTDNFATRYLINDVSVILNKPLVFGAIQRFAGQIMVLNYKNGPTLRCIFPEPPHPLEVPSCDEIGIIGSIAGIIGAMQATEVFKIILDLKGVLSGKIFYIDSLDFNSQIFTFKKDPIQSRIVELGEYDDICLSGNEHLQVITPSEFKKMAIENTGLKVIDLRSEYDRIPIEFECINIPSYEIVQKLDLLPKKGPLVFYCKNGIKSSIVINYLERVHHMESKDLFNLNIY